MRRRRRRRRPLLDDFKDCPPLPVAPWAKQQWGCISMIVMPLRGTIVSEGTGSLGIGEDEEEEEQATG